MTRIGRLICQENFTPFIHCSTLVSSTQGDMILATKHWLYDRLIRLSAKIMETTFHSGLADKCWYLRPNKTKCCTWRIDRDTKSVWAVVQHPRPKHFLASNLPVMARRFNA